MSQRWRGSTASRQSRQELNSIVKTAEKNHWRLIAASAGRIHNALHTHCWPHFPFMGCSHSCSRGKDMKHENKDDSVVKKLLSRSDQTANPENVDCTNKQLRKAFLWLEFIYLLCALTYPIHLYTLFFLAYFLAFMVHWILSGEICEVQCYFKPK